MKINFTRKESIKMARETLKGITDNIEITNKTKVGRFFTKLYLQKTLLVESFKLYKGFRKMELKVKDNELIMTWSD